MQTFQDAKSLAAEKQLDNKFEIRENEMSLAKQDDTSLEVSLQIGSIASSTEEDKVNYLQDAKYTEAKKSLDLDDSQTVW